MSLHTLAKAKRNGISISRRLVQARSLIHVITADMLRDMRVFV